MNPTKTQPLALAMKPDGWEMIPHAPRLPTHRVRIRVALAGLCRTDVQILTGQRPAPAGRVVGHEAAGWVEHIPAAVRSEAQARGWREGDRVAFFPFFPCGRCSACKNAEGWGRCVAPSVLGLHEDGAFAPTVDVPASVVVRAPDCLSWEQLAYAEPVAAALAVRESADLKAARAVAVVGRGRIAELTARALESDGTGRPVWRLTPEEARARPSEFDALVETAPTEAGMHAAAAALKPGGLLVLKSRPSASVPWPHEDMVLRRLRAVGMPYGDFEQGLSAMADGSLRVDDMMGPRFPWTPNGVRAALALERSSRETAGKIFLAVGLPVAPIC